MPGPRNGRPTPPPASAERRWHSQKAPLAVTVVRPDGAPLRANRPAAFDVCDALRRVCADIALKCPDFGHIEVSRLLISYTPSRNRSRYGLQARVTPMRFRNGAASRRIRGTDYGVQRYVVDGREILYVVTFCLPRFLDQPFEEKLVTIFHELYHISPAFDGDLRRHPGRYAIHSHSQREYDARMGAFVRAYLKGQRAAEHLAFLRMSYSQLVSAHGAVTGVIVPRPRLVPLAK